MCLNISSQSDGVSYLSLLECFYSPVHSAFLFDMTWIKNDQKVQQGQNQKNVSIEEKYISNPDGIIALIQSVIWKSFSELFKVA